MRHDKGRMELFFDGHMASTILIGVWQYCCKTSTRVERGCERADSCIWVVKKASHGRCPTLSVWIDDWLTWSQGWFVSLWGQVPRCRARSSCEGRIGVWRQLRLVQFQVNQAVSSSKFMPNLISNWCQMELLKLLNQSSIHDRQRIEAQGLVK